MKNTTSLTPGILVAIAIGAVLGALAREALAFFANSPEPQAFPWGTLIANLSGAFLLGLFATYLDRIISHALFRPLWEIGFIRSFTTLSTFSLEGIRMTEAREWENLFPYVAVSVLGGLLAVFLGDRLGSALSASQGLKEDLDVRDRVEGEL
jgi:CrcB protein